VLWEFARYEPEDFGKVGCGEEVTGPPRYLAFSVDRDGEIMLKDLGDAGTIDSLVGLARKHIYRAGHEVYSPLATGAQQRLAVVTRELHDIIFAPLEPSLASRREIFISPDGQLNLLPFEILPCPDGDYVVEKFAVSYLSSGRDLLKPRRKQLSGDRALVLADPDFDFTNMEVTGHEADAPADSSAADLSHRPARGVSSCLSSAFTPLRYSRQETRSVIEALSSGTNLEVVSLLGSDALEEVLKGLAIAPRVLHLATHGYFCEDADPGALENPLLRCGLALAGANRVLSEKRRCDLQTEDGVLTAFEASGLNLIGTELVTLSACETGVGEVKVGEGVYGLRRALQCAGAETIVMSLWEVPDKETAELMGLFYGYWLSGKSKKQALRRAVLAVLNSCRTRYDVAHPLFWGGFVLSGNPD
jgi:CHAT domain-containing protein